MILVTGASGLIGRRLVPPLTKRGAVSVLLRDRTLNPFEDLPQVRVCRGDISEYAAVEAASSGVTAVIHLAAAMHGTEGEYVAGTLRGTENVVRVGLEKQIKLLYMSSLSVLALATIPFGTEVDESWDYEPRPELRGFYTKYKLLAEQCVQDAVHRRGLAAAILRPAEVLQADRPHLSFATGFDVGPVTVSLIDRQANVPLVELEDLVALILRLLETCEFRGEIIHIVDPTLVSQSQYLTARSLRTGESRPRWHIPIGLPLAAARGLDLVSKLSGIHFPLSVHRLRSAIGPRRFSQKTLQGYVGPFEFRGVQSFLRGGAQADSTSGPITRNP